MFKKLYNYESIQHCGILMYHINIVHDKDLDDTNEPVLTIVTRVASLLSTEILSIIE